ncbi:MAG: hypothetical protein M4579_003356 [Chaenotheca gracillima]|nr:MAG: hypothetical protein M4579_003356 [Chaenotheca gracillima]
MGFLQKIIKNKSMEVDPPEIYSWRVFLLACAACFGGTLFGMDIGAIGGVLTMPAFESEFNFDPDDPLATANLSANIVSVLQAGAFAGALIASPIADKWGRKPALLLASMVGAVGVILQAASSGKLASLYVGRFIAGLGLGAATMLTPTYISENSPRAIRGLLTGFYQLFETAGAMIAFWINYGSLLHLKGNSTWIVPLAMQALPAVLLFSGMLLCNESPRFLAKQDKWEEAHRILAKIRNLPPDHTYVQVELQEMSAQLEHEKALFAGSSYWDLQKEMWLVPGNRKRAIISIALMVGQQMTGTNAVNYYAPQIFTNLGITGNANGLFATGVYGIVKMVGCGLFLIFCADSLGRKKSLLWTAAAMGVAMFYIGFYVRFDPPVKNAPVPPAGYVALVMVYLFAAFFQFGWGPVCWIYVAEIPSQRLRGLNVGNAAATQWLFNFVVARATPPMLVTVGNAGYGTYFIFGSFCFTMMILTWFFIPETKGLSLERMDELFGVTDLKEVADPGLAAAEHPFDEKTSHLHIDRV